jgi:hypothetical protein
MRATYARLGDFEMAYDYLRQRAIRSKRLADVFEEKAKNAIGPETAGKVV